MKLDSIQVGDAEPSPAGSLPMTGINKEPVSSADVLVSGLADDTIVDTDNHGGPDQAVYVYTRDDYDWWESELERSLPGGMFGENLTISGISSADVQVGDRFVFAGGVTLEATAARVPCAVFAHKMGDPNMVKRFREARLPGIYCRVIVPGRVETGASVRREPASGTVSIVETMDLFYDVKASPERLEAALNSPIAARTRATAEKRLAKQQ